MEYTLRPLNAGDTFLMFKILSKIGVKELKSCFEMPEVKEAIANASSGESKDDAVANVGITVVLEAASIIMAHLDDCKTEIYKFASGVTGMKAADIAAMPMGDFAGLIIDIVKMDGFKDFFTVASKLLK